MAIAAHSFCLLLSMMATLVFLLVGNMATAAAANSPWSFVEVHTLGTQSPAAWSFVQVGGNKKEQQQAQQPKGQQTNVVAFGGGGGGARQQPEENVHAAGVEQQGNGQIEQIENGLRKAAERALLKGKKDYGELKQRLDVEQLQAVQQEQQPDRIRPIEEGKEEEEEKQQQEFAAPVVVGDVAAEPLAAGSKQPLEHKSSENQIENHQVVGEVVKQDNEKQGEPGAADLSLSLLLLNGTTGEAETNNNSQQLPNYSNGTEVSNSTEIDYLGVYNQVRNKLCVGWCHETLAPWYSDVVKASCAQQENYTNNNNNTETGTECAKGLDTSEDTDAHCRRQCSSIVGKDLPRFPFFTCSRFCELAYAGLDKTEQYCKSRC